MIAGILALVIIAVGAVGVFIAMQNLKNLCVIKFNQFTNLLIFAFLGLLYFTFCFNANCKLDRKSIGLRIRSVYNY